MKILHLIPRLDYSGSARQLALLGPGLCARGHAVSVGVLADVSGPHASTLRGAGIPVHVLGKGRRFDPLCVWNLRCLLRSLRPDIVHVWGKPALRCLALSAGKARVPIVASQVLPSCGSKTRAGILDRYLLGRPVKLIARGSTEADRYMQAGVRPERITLVPPAVAGAGLAVGAENILPFKSDHLPARFILCAGVMEPDKGFRDAVWAFDILKFLFDDLKLLLAGDGPERLRLERFSRAIQLADCVHFLGPQSDIGHLLTRAALVWVPSVGDCGTYVTLEAMAAGTPLIASNVPSLREIIRDRQTGLLVPPGNKVALGRRTRELLRDPGLAGSLAEAGRREVSGRSPAHTAARYADIYAGVAA